MQDAPLFKGTSKVHFPQKLYAQPQIRPIPLLRRLHTAELPMRLIPFLFSLILTTTTVMAEPFSIDTLRAAVAQRDFGKVDTGLDDAQSDFLKGKRSADDIRDLYIALSRSAPEMVQFVEDWL